MNPRKIITALYLVICAFANLTAQNTGCDSDHLNNTLLQTDPVFHRSFQYMEQMLHAQQGLDASQRSNDIYTLPVVVHVIHTGNPYGSGVNITDEQIYSAIEALNEDYRHIAGSNGDGAGPDIGIEFCMAARDPNGQPTTGIVRVNGSSVPLYATQGIEASGGNGAVEESVKALSTWPRASYLNIWVVNEIEGNDGGGGIQGYAYFPINNPIDGVVILYNAIGTVGELKSYTNMNRVLSHEVGHYLGLYHTFNATSACGAEADCSTAGDRVCDTPPTIQSSNCTAPACSGTQQVENYMDYTQQTCQDMFTEGQKLRMRTTLETQRTSMITSLGCSPVFTTDIGITAIISPSGSNCLGAATPQVTLTNFGSNTITSATIQYNVDAVGSNTYNWTGSLASGSSVTVALGSINPSAGSHTFYAWTSAPNGSSDQNSANNQSTGEFTITNGAAATLDVVTDYFGTETTWKIFDENDVEILNGGPYANGTQGAHNLEPICLEPGCYTLIMYDEYGDGQGFTAGSFSLTSSTGDVLATASNNWGAQSVNDFCLEGTVPTGNPPVASFTIQDNTLCRNVQNDYTNTSTNSPTSYAWTFEGGSPATSTQASPQNVTYANAGVYDVTLTATNTYGSHTYTCTNCVTVNADPTVTVTGTNPMCSTTNTGSVASTVTGTNPISYAWSNGATSANISSLAAGAYTLTITDGNGCTKQGSATLTAPSAIVISGTATNVSCAGQNNGSISVSATGGTGTKTFTWNNGASGASVSNLAAGSYTVTATDANGCTQTQSYTITNPTAIVISGTATNGACSGANTGSITVSATGGTGTKTFSWSNGASGATISNLAAGSYTVTASDANGCSVTQTYTISSSPAITITGTPTNPTCAGVNNGSITASATGGTGNKTFSWSNGATGATASNLGGGSFTVTATDANGCTATQSFTLTAPSAIAITGTATNVSCNAGSNGSITVSASGGTGTKTFSWSNSQTGATISNLVAGSYTVTATDINGCTATQSYTVTAPNVLNANLTDFDIACDDAFGSAQVNPNGGTSPYTVLWSNGNTGNNSGNLNAGSYSVTVTDSRSCTASANFIITQSASLSVYANATAVTCHGAANGSISLSVSGGNSVYTYLWSNGASASSISNLSPGTYGIIVTDGNGCQGSSEATITEPGALIVSVESDDISCNGLTDGIANSIASGGVSPYSYQWSNGASTAAANDLGPGIQTVTIYDANNCSTSASVTISEPFMLIANAIVLSPETCDGNDGSAEVMIEGGSPGYFTQWSDGSNDAVLSGVASGDYSVAVTDVNGCLLNLNINIPYECEVVIPSTQLIDADCNRIDVSLNTIITCDPVPGAEMYQWRFSSIGGTILTDEYSLGNMFYTSQIPNVAEGAIYVVTVKALIASNWGPFGQGCTIAMQLPEEVLVTGLSSEDCGSTISTWGETLTAIEIPDVMNYQWHITGVDYDWTTYTVTNVLTLESSMQLVPGSTYSVELRCAIGSGQFTEWSPSCEFSMAMDIAVTEIESAGFLLIYPNPGDGEKIFFDMGNLRENASIENIELYGPTGNLIEEFNINLAPGNNRTIEHRFINKLASGMYVLRYKLNGRDSEEKLIVR
jgi:PKD repeat protein